MNPPRKVLRRPQPSEVLHRDSPADYTGPDASERVLYINLGFLKFGTTDRLQGAALVVLMLLFPILIVVIVLGMFPDSNAWADRIFSWVGPVIVLVSGVAVGRAT